MIPQKTVEELIIKHSSLEKDLASGELDKKLLMRFGKEPSIETSYGYKKALFIR